MGVPPHGGATSFARRRFVGLLVLVALSGVLVLAGTLRAGFVYDDPASLRFSNELAEGGAGSFLGSLRGLHHASLHLDWLLFGDEPAGYHATNLLLYGLAVLLAGLLALRLAGRPGVALAAALLFAVHPVHVEAVASIENRKEISAFLLVALALLAWTSRRLPRAGPVAGLVLYGVGVVWVKDVAVAGALLLLPAADLLQGRPGRRVAARSALPALLALAALVVLREPLRACFSPEFVHDVSDWHFTSYGQVLAGVAESFPRNLGLLLAPLRLIQDHPFPAGEPASPATLLGALLLAGTVATPFLLARRAPLAAFAVLWVVATWLPSSNVLPLIPHYVAERFLFVPSFGACLLVALALERLGEGARAAGRRPNLAPVLGALLVLAGATRSFVRSGDWVDSETLNATALARGGDTWRLHHRAAGFARAAGDPAGAASHLERALELMPGVALFHFELGRARLELADFAGAVDAFREAARLADAAAGAPRLPSRFGFRTGQESGPTGEPQRFLGVALARAGELDEALDALREALRRQPLDPETHNDASVVHALRAGLESTLPTWGIRRGEDGALAAAWFAAGREAERSGDEEAARAAYGQAFCFGPADPALCNGFAWFLVTRSAQEEREPEVAVALARRAVAVDGETGDHWGTLGAALLASGRADEAIPSLERALELKERVDPYNALALALAHFRRGEPEAARTWQSRANEALADLPEPAEDLRRLLAEVEIELGSAGG